MRTAKVTSLKIQHEICGKKNFIKNIKAHKKHKSLLVTMDIVLFWFTATRTSCTCCWHFANNIFCSLSLLCYFFNGGLLSNLQTSNSQRATIKLVKWKFMFPILLFHSSTEYLNGRNISLGCISRIFLQSINNRCCGAQKMSFKNSSRFSLCNLGCDNFPLVCFVTIFFFFFSHIRTEIFRP